MAFARRAAILMALILVALPASRVNAQIPDKFTNLKVLPKDIQKQQLVATMRSFSMALGVRCDHCHVEKDHKTDWAADDKDSKKIARVMMKMVGTVNTTIKDKVGALSPDVVTVSCVTCHHGVATPRTLGGILDETLATAGLDSTLARYHRLRDQYYGSAAYDFSEWSLISIAENLTHQNPPMTDAALALLNVNLGYYPQSAGTYARMAETYLVKGDTTTAMTNFDKAETLAPDDPWLKRRVEMIKAKAKK